MKLYKATRNLRHLYLNAVPPADYPVTKQMKRERKTTWGIKTR
jgi:hypothetical protein